MILTLTLDSYFKTACLHISRVVGGIELNCVLSLVVNVLHSTGNQVRYSSRIVIRCHCWPGNSSVVLHSICVLVNIERTGSLKRWAFNIWMDKTSHLALRYRRDPSTIIETFASTKSSSQMPLFCKRSRRRHMLVPYCPNDWTRIAHTTDASRLQMKNAFYYDESIRCKCVLVTASSSILLKKNTGDFEFSNDLLY